MSGPGRGPCSRTEPSVHTSTDTDTAADKKGMQTALHATLATTTTAEAEVNGAGVDQAAESGRSRTEGTRKDAERRTCGCGHVGQLVVAVVLGNVCALSVCV